jgi:hypothetical protein
VNRFFKKVEKPQFELSRMGMRTKSKFAKKVSSKVNVFFARWETVSDVIHTAMQTNVTKKIDFLRNQEIQRIFIEIL